MRRSAVRTRHRAPLFYVGRKLRGQLCKVCHNYYVIMDILFALFLFFSNPTTTATTTAECSRYIIGFRGLGGAFDLKAFEEYAVQRKGCTQVYNFTEFQSATEFVKSINKPYELYGYSAGAVSVGQVLKQKVRRPEHAITIGALSTVDVDFSLYNIKFDNWFDASGRGSRSPGEHFPNVSHDRMQSYINQFYR